MLFFMGAFYSPFASAMVDLIVIFCVFFLVWFYNVKRQCFQRLKCIESALRSIHLSVLRTEPHASIMHLTDSDFENENHWSEMVSWMPSLLDIREEKVISPEGVASKEKIHIISGYVEARLCCHRLVVGRFPSFPVFPTRIGYAASTLLTMLGVWGTFWGINQGLVGSTLTRTNQTTNSLVKGASVLFEGMGTAFQTSLWGMGCAIFALSVVAYFRYQFHQVRSQVDSLVDKTLILESSPAVLLAQNTRSLEKISDSLESILSSRESKVTFLLEQSTQYMERAAASLERILALEEARVGLPAAFSEHLAKIVNGMDSTTTLLKSVDASLKEESGKVGDLLHPSYDPAADMQIVLSEWMLQWEEALERREKEKLEQPTKNTEA